MGDRYTKVFESLLDSSIWFEDSDTRCVWVTMMALADAQGVVDNTIPGLARRALPKLALDDAIAATVAALEKFQAPDPFSRTPDNEGRRIEALENGGWLLLNHAKYREKRQQEERKRQNREAQQRKRDRQRASSDVSTRQHASSESAQAEAEAEEDAGEKEKTTARARARGDDDPTALQLTGEEVAREHNRHAREAAKADGHLTPGMLFPYVAHREEFDTLAGNLRALTDDGWRRFLAWWWRPTSEDPDAWAWAHYRHASPKALLKGWAINVAQYTDPDGFAQKQRERATKAQQGERREDPRHGGEAFQELPPSRRKRGDDAKA